MRIWRVAATIGVALLAVPAWWISVNIAYAGCSQTRAVDNQLEEWIECPDNFCHTCWKFNNPTELDFCTDNVPARTYCGCTTGMVVRTIESYKCDGACNCTNIRHGRLVLFVNVEEGRCATRNCLF